MRSLTDTTVCSTEGKDILAVFDDLRLVISDCCCASSFFSKPVRGSIEAMAAWTVLDPAKEARAVLDEMAKSLLDDPSMPAPAQLQSPPAEVLRTLMAGNAAPGNRQGQLFRGARLPVRSALCYSHCAPAG